MKIKYIGNFNDGTGWAKASTYNALALDAAGFDVYCEEIKYHEFTSVLEDRISQLTDKKSENFDVIVQHCLPRDYRYIGGSKNIGFVALETLNLKNVLWVKKIDMMDLVWVPNKASKECLVKSGINPDKVKIFHHSFNFDKVSKNDSGATINELRNSFNFAFVGEFTKRKNLEALVLAFHNEFNKNENVNLYIKTSGDTNTISKFCANVKDRMGKTNNYKKEIIVCDYLNESVLLSTLKQCHAFVMPSYGEAWSYPAMEAMAIGLPVIYTSGIGIEEYNTGVFKVKSRISPCYGAIETTELYNSDENWLEIDILDLQKQMRDVFNMYVANPNEYKMLSNQCIEDISKFNFTNNELLKGIL
jgi:glycosyltransferase involved in cell wall biosynthesis